MFLASRGFCDDFDGNAITGPHEMPHKANRLRRKFPDLAAAITPLANSFRLKIYLPPEVERP
jgi:hypothetical protein